MANGTPMVYHPRTEFAEYVILREGIIEWGGGVQMPLRKLESGQWKSALEEAFQLTPKKIRANGAAQAAVTIIDLV